MYVVNATCKEDAKRGADFARENNIRLVIKGTGHDYIRRSTAPNSLSIWTHHMKGLTFRDTFKSQGRSYSIDTPAVTMAAGTQMVDVNSAAVLKNLTLLSAVEETVSIGGYLTGGGYAALAPAYGLAADQVLEMDTVTPSGEILTVNEC